MRKVKYLLHIFIISLFLFNNFTSCALFENDVADFMEKYTETAAIEQHSFNVETYNDASNQLCIASDGDAEITLLMRNPKTFSLIPSVDFNNLASNYSRSVVSIDQEDSFTVKLSLPQEFLIPVDEGKDITALINLHEPMSGRDFDRYTVNLSCNSKPPLILNPTIMNKDNQVFVLAFDMPNEEEVAIRHKDLASVEINGVSYPVQVTTETDSTSDPEHPDLQVARYTFTDPHFKRSNPGYSELGGKTFDHNPNNSVYFETDDPFKNGDKEYTIILRDRAGLTSEVKASTSISKLNKPVIKDQNGYPIAESGIAAVPYDENTERGIITIEPPTEDHLGHPVSGTTVHYRVYEATGSGRIYTSGTTMTAKTIELPQNTYRVEAYATLTNYENSATNTVKFRFMNNVLFVRACTDSAGYNGDGSEAAPYTTIQEALDDINNTTDRPDKASTFTIMVEGDFTTSTYDMSGISGDYGIITLHDDYWTDKLIIKKNPRCLVTNLAKLKSITLENSLDSAFEVTIGDVTVTNSGGDGITHDSSNTLVIDGTTITGCNTGIHATNGTVAFKTGTISNCNLGISGEDCNLNVHGGIISENASSAISYGGNPGVCRISGGTITHNGSSNEAAIYLDAGTCYITGGSIVDNYYRGIHVANSSTLYLYGGSVTNNAICGINVLIGNSIHVKNNPIVKDNTNGSPAVPANIILGAGTTTPAIPDVQINIDGPLTTGAKLGVTSAKDPAAVGDAYTFASGYVNSGSPSQFFTSDKGFSIVGGSGGTVSIAKTGSNGGMYTALDYNFTIALSDANADGTYSIYPEYAKTFTLTPNFTRSESSGSPTQLYYNSVNKKLYLEPAYTTLASGDNTVSWEAALYIGGFKVDDCVVTSNSSGLSVEVPALEFIDVYTLKISETFLGLTKEINFVLNCAKDANAVAGLITSLTTSQTVTIEGPLSADDFIVLSTALKAINKPNVYVNLDLSNTNLTSIPDSSFKDCARLSGVSFPSGITTIGQYSFENCTGLTSVNLPSSVTLLANQAFDGCSNISSYTLPDNDEVVYQNRIFGGWAITELVVLKGRFTGSAVIAVCPNLTKVTLPADLGSYNAFYSCHNITEIVYLGTRSQWDAHKNTWLQNAGFNLSTVTVTCIDD